MGRAAEPFSNKGLPWLDLPALDPGDLVSKSLERKANGVGEEILQGNGTLLFLAPEIMDPFLVQ